MSTDARSKIEAAMTRRILHGEPWTHSELAAVARSAGGGYRDAARLTQKWRRQGWATFARVGYLIYWSATPAGVAAHATGVTP